MAHGARILDIGGQSTRPGSSAVSEGVELSRILPAIKSPNFFLAKAKFLPVSRLLKQQLGPECPYISIDTSFASVAHAAVLAGADLVNDVSGGTRDPQMLQTVHTC